jgi:hypothetical protein
VTARSAKRIQDFTDWADSGPQKGSGTGSAQSVIFVDWGCNVEPQTMLELGILAVEFFRRISAIGDFC